MADNHPPTNLTDRDVLQALESRWKEYRCVLHHADQAVFDKLLEHAQAHANTSEVQNHQSIERAFVSILIEQQKQLDDLEDRLDYLEMDLNEEVCSPQ